MTDNSQANLGWLAGRTIAFMGDSVTADVRANYVTLLLDRLADSIDVASLNVINSGIDSSSIFDILDRIVEIIVEHDPDVVVSFVGINDAKMFRKTHQALVDRQVFEERYSTFLDFIDLQRSRKKIVITPPPLLFDEIRDGEFLADYWYWDPERYVEYVDSIRSVASRHKECVVADVYSQWPHHNRNNHRPFYPDGVHPNIYGHRVIAAAVLEALGKIG